MIKQQNVVIVTGADHITGMATARSLVDTYYYIIGIAANINAPTCSSAAWQKIYSETDDRIALLKRIVQDLDMEAIVKKPLLLPCQDEWVLWLSDNRDNIANTVSFILPTKQAINIGMDKASFQAYAEKNEFQVPRTKIVKDVKNLREVVELFKGHKFIIKPEVRLADWDSHFPNIKLFYFESINDFYNSELDIEKIFDCCNSVLIQQWVEGADADVYFVLMAINKKGLILDHFCGRKLIQWPRNSGSTAICKAADVSEIILEARRLAIQLHFIGLCSVEFKKHKDGSGFYITEPTIGRNDFQSSVGDFNGKNLTLTLVDEHFYPGKLINENNKLLKPKLWVDEVSTIRAIKNSKIESHTAKTIFCNVFRINTVVFKLNDLKPFYKTLAQFIKFGA